MKSDYSVQKIILMRGPFNAFHAEAFGLIFKLSYHFEKSEHPRLEIFLNDDEAKKKEWSIYGALIDDEDERFASVHFSKIEEKKDIRVLSSEFRVIFNKYYRDYFTYHNGAKEPMLVYEFTVSHK